METNKIMVILAVLVGCLLLYVFIFPNAETTMTDPIQEKVIVETTMTDPIQEKAIIPGLDYTCDELIPKDIEIFFNSVLTDELGNSRLRLKPGTSILNNNISLAGLCSYNLKPGQKASEFSCEGGFVVESKQISNEGIIQEKNPRTITYTMNFNDSSCEVVQGVGFGRKMGILKCKILSSKCEWKYSNPPISYPIIQIQV